MNPQPLQFRTAPALAGFTLFLSTIAPIATAQSCDPQGLATLVPIGDPTAAGFGESAAMSGDVVVVSTSSSDALGYEAATVHVYRRVSDVWMHEALLLPPGGSSAIGFGASVAVDGDTVVVGADGDTEFGQGAGAAYTYRFDGAAWQFEAKLVSSTTSASDNFGSSVAISEGTLIVGAPRDRVNKIASGSATVFEFDGVLWSEQRLLLPPIANHGDLFGFAAALDSGLAVISMPRAGFDSVPLAAQSLVFRRSDGEWSHEYSIPSGVQSGVWVDIDGETVVIGMPGNDNNTGEAVVYKSRLDLTPVLWQRQARLSQTDGGFLDRFGRAVSVSGTTVAVGAPGHGSSGSVYIFQRSNNEWPESHELISPGLEPGGQFGNSVMLRSGTIVVGAPDSGGSAHLLSINCTIPCTPDFDQSGTLDVFDVFAFLTAFNAMEPAADLVGEGFWNIYDVFAFLDLFNAGCP